ncbi:MAG TPA: hypothetical protein DEQ34_00385 [Balneolaceae bacterium]|nr:hypothetical protein [Balneolaceae bacterium]
MELLKGIKPRNIGPAGMSGRITAIDVVTNDPQVIYVGAASGGLWKSESGGVSWEPIFDNYGAASIGAIDIYQKNPSIVWVGTGEGNPRNSQTSGRGVYKSIDGGRTFELMGLEGTRNIHRVIIDPTNPDVVYVGAQGSAWGESEDRGVFKTTDGGKTWKKILYVDTKTGVGEMVMDPANPNKLFVNMWEFRRWPWFFKSGGPGSGLYMTVDGGENWKELTSKDGLPEGDLGRMGLAIAPSKPDVVYALIESEENAMYRSTDGGYSWHLREKVKNDSDIGNRPFYYYEIYVDPANENRVYSIWSFMSKSEDGGKSFEQISNPEFGYNWVHPDHHAFWINPNNGDHIIEGNDGGLNISYDGGKTFRFVENIPVGQFYHVNVDMQFPYNVYGGMQDNGSWQGPAYVLRAGGIRNSYWEELYFGDGFDVVVDPSDSRYAYAMSQQGNVGRVDLETGMSRFIRPIHPDGEDLRFNWNAGISVDPFDPATIYFGSQYVHKSTDRGENWTIISPDLTTNDPDKQMQHESGGLTMDATGAENHTTILSIAPSPVKEGVMWVGTDDGRLHVTKDGGENWTDVSKNLKGVPAGSWMAQIKASRFNEGEAFVVINNYRNDDWGTYLMHTTNYGKKWTNIAAKKGVDGYVLSFVQDLEEPNLMFLGTEFGLYVSVDGAKNWTKWTNSYPTVSTYDMVIHPREHDLVIATFGRSFWVMDDIRPLREMARNGASELDKVVNIYPTPDAYQFVTRQAAGTRFAADAMFFGDNRPDGAMISFSINKEAAEKPDTKKGGAMNVREGGFGGGMPGMNFNRRGRDGERVNVEIFDANGDTVRTYQVTAVNNGLNRFFWNMRMDGEARPTQRESRGGFNFTPSGNPVLPGMYKVKLSYGGGADSTMLKVDFDPRLDISVAEVKETYAMADELAELNRQGVKVAEILKSAKKIMDANDEYLKADPRTKEELKDITKMSKETRNILDSLFVEMFGPEDDGRQGIVRNPDHSVSNALRMPGRYLGSAMWGPGSNEQFLLKQASEAMAAITEKVNNFIRTEWPEYQKAIEDADLSAFKAIEPIEN